MIVGVGLYPLFSQINRFKSTKGNIFDNKMKINLRKLKNSKFDFSTNNNDRYSLNKFYDKETVQSLYELNINKSILEGIYNNKNILIRNMKLKDRHGDGLIPKFDFLSIFWKTNCHHKLRIELIDKILNIYLYNEPNVMMIYYLHLINAICNDIKIILNNNNNYSNYSLNKTRNLPNIKEFSIKEIINKINSISNELFNYSKRIVSFLELKNILEQKMIFLNKTQIIQLLKFLEIENPNCFTFNEFMDKIKSNPYCFNKTIIPHRSFRINNNLKEKESDRYSQTINSDFFKDKNKIVYLKKNSLSNSQNMNINNNDNNIKLYKTQEKFINKIMIKYF